MNISKNKLSDKPMEIPIDNPFIRKKDIWNSENKQFDKIKTAIFTIFLVPIRIIIVIFLLLVAWTLANIGLYGKKRELLTKEPLIGWRRQLRVVVAFFFRSMFFFGSANWIKVKGKLASTEEAPILVAAPHSTFFDALAVIISGPASVVGKIEAGEIPFFGKIIDFAQPIYVKRENFDSRAKTIQDIQERVRSKENDWPQIMIFPEGTCTNGECLIEFKPGAFYPGANVQPVLIRYPNKVDTYTWAWKGPSVFILIWRTLAQLNNSMEIEYLPVIHPNEEEIKNPKLFARNVQQLMAKALDLPIAQYSFEDCKLMSYAETCKLKLAPKIADIARLREKLGLASSQIEEYIVKDNFQGTKNLFYEYEDFLKHLQIPASNVSYTLFKQFVDSPDEIIDFKEYLLHSLFLIQNQKSKIEFVRVLFQLYGDSGKLKLEPFVRIMGHFLKISTKNLTQLFMKIDKEDRGFIIFQDFVKVTEKDPNFMKIYKPNQNFRRNDKDQ